MKLIWIELAALLFQTDAQVKRRIEMRGDMETVDSYLNDRVFIQKLHNHGTAGSHFINHKKAVALSTAAAAAAGTAGFAGALQKEKNTLERMGYAFLVGGAFSNLSDRLRKGYVVDYVSFRTPFKRLNDLVFNLSDFFIFIGSIFICIGQRGHTGR